MYQIKNIQEVAEYVKRHERFVIFGTGEFARVSSKMLKSEGMFLSAFVVSSNYFAEGGGN